MTVEEAYRQHMELMWKNIRESWEETKEAYSQKSFEDLSKPFQGMPDEDMPQWKRWD
jgi:hypothetical protein